MSLKRASRQSSLRASTAIKHLAKDLQDSDVDEHASDLSVSSYNDSEQLRTSTSESDLSSSDLTTSDDIDVLESDTDGSEFIGTPKKNIFHPIKHKRSIVGLLSRYLNNCKQKQSISVKKIVLLHFRTSIDKLKSAFWNQSHPFAIVDSLNAKTEYVKRQTSLFPPSLLWRPYSFDDKFGCLPQPLTSPLLIRPQNRNGTLAATSLGRFRRFEYDKDQRLLYVGGYVKSLAWSPPRILSERIGSEDPKEAATYLAIATYPSPGTRVMYSDAARNGPGLVQIWDCGHLTLTCSSGEFYPKPHVFIAHDWGLVLDLSWVPLPITLAARITKQRAQSLNCSLYSISPSPLVQRTVGHLIFACQDGLVRIVAIPRGPLDAMYFRTNRKYPLYEINPKAVLKLSPCQGNIPEWVGWPTCLHIRMEYPDRLFVGYSKGHVGLYDLSCVDSLLFDTAACHLSPVRFFRLINGPIRSMSLNPLNGRQLMVQGFDTAHHIWDIEDTVSNTVHSAEFHWPLAQGLPGGQVVWKDDMVFCSREHCVGGHFTRPSFAELITKTDTTVIQTSLDAPRDDARYLIPLGIQSVTHLNFSEPLNTLACATDRGRVELAVCSLDGRSRSNPKFRYLSHLRIPLCQWSFAEHEQCDKLPDGTSSDELGDKSQGYLASDDKDDPGKLNNSRQQKNHFPDPNCSDCQSSRSFCWHKLWDCETLKIDCEFHCPKKPYLDFLKTPYLSVTQAAFYPYPQAATWLATATSFGFVQFHCLDFLYLRDFDKMLGRPPGGISSRYLDNPNPPLAKPGLKWTTRLLWPHSIKHRQHDSKVMREKFRWKSSSTRPRRRCRADSLVDSDATEPMTGQHGLDQAVPEKESTDTDVQVEKQDVESDETDACVEEDGMTSPGPASSPNRPSSGPVV